MDPPRELTPELVELVDRLAELTRDMPILDRVRLQFWLNHRLLPLPWDNDASDGNSGPE